MIIPGEE
jgi:hypothetical protein